MLHLLRNSPFLFSLLFFECWTVTGRWSCSRRCEECYRGKTRRLNPCTRRIMIFVKSLLSNGSKSAVLRFLKAYVCLGIGYIFCAISRLWSMHVCRVWFQISDVCWGYLTVTNCKVSCECSVLKWHNAHTCMTSESQKDIWWTLRLFNYANLLCWIFIKLGSIFHINCLLYWNFVDRM